MKLGLVCGPDSPRIAHKLKVNGVSVNAADLIADGGKAKLASLHELGLEPCQIAAFGFNPLTSDLKDRQANEQIVEAALPYLQRTGCQDLVVNGGNRHPSGFAGSHRDNYTDAILDEIARALEPWIKRCEEYKVNLTIEPHIQCAIDTPERFLKLKALIGSSRVMVTLDTCNFLHFKDLWNPFPRIADICAQLKGHYTSVHLKNVDLAPGTHLHINEVPFLTGKVEWAPILKIIKRDTPNAYLILEKVKSEEEALVGITAIREMIGES